VAAISVTIAALVLIAVGLLILWLRSKSNALDRAIERGDVARARELLDSGFDANARNRWGQPALYCAVLRGDLEMVRLLMDRGARAEQRSRLLGDTALTLAVKDNRPDIVTLLLDKGADPNAPAGLGVTPLALASRLYGGKMARLLMERGARL
jgi:ankyrin repeat protein